MASTIPIYTDCVAALRASLRHLDEATAVLDAGVSDFPRLGSVLNTVRHYELIPQPTLVAAEASLRDEIAPSVALLLSRAKRQIDRQARRIETLKARAGLQDGRLASAHDQKPSRHLGSFSRDRGKTKSVLDGEARLKAQMTRQRKEGLKYSVERLELEVLQKERELRKQLDA